MISFVWHYIAYTLLTCLKKLLTHSLIQYSLLVHCQFVMAWVCSVVATRSSNGSQSGSSGVSGTQLLTAQDEKLGFEAAVAALGLNLSIYGLC